MFNILIGAKCFRDLGDSTKFRLLSSESRLEIINERCLSVLLIEEYLQGEKCM